MASKTINTILQLKDKFSSTMKKVANTTKDSERQVKLLTNNVESFKAKATSGFGNVATKVAALSASFVGVTAVVAGLKNSLEFMKEYQNSTIDLQVKTGMEGKELATAKQAAKDLYNENIGESFSDITDTMTTVNQVTGATGDQMKDLTRQAVIFKDVFGGEAEESVKTVDTMMKQFGITSDQAYNLLAQGQQNGLNKSGDMLDVINEYSNQFKAAGYSVEDMFNTLHAGLAGGSFSLDYVADAMKEANIRLKDGSKTSAKAYEALGLNAEEMTKKYAQGGDSAKQAMAEVFQAIQKIEDPLARNDAAVGLFGTKFEDLQAQVLLSMGNVENVFDSTVDTMGEVANIKYDNVGTAIQGIGRAFETGIVARIADNVLPMLNEFGNWINDHMPEIQNEIDYAFKLGEEAVNKFKDALGWAKDNANWLIPVITGLTAAIAAQAIINTITGMYKKWQAVTKGLTAAQIIMNAVSAASPFGLIALAIGVLIGLGVALWQNWDWISQKAGELWAWLTEVWEGIRDSSVEIFNNFIQFFVDLWEGIKQTSTDVWNSITQFFTDTWNSIKETASTVWNGVKQFFSDTWDAISQKCSEVWDGIKEIFNGIVDFVKNVFQGNWSAAWDSVVNAFKKIFDKIVGFAKKPINGVIDLVNGLIGKINGVSVDIPDWVPGVGGKTFKANIPKIPKYATGTSYFKGGLAQTNERGGEIKEYPNGTRIIPHDLSKRMIGSGAGVNVNVTIQGNVIGNESYANELASHIIKRIQLTMGNV